MQKAIYKITSKKITEMLVLEEARKSRFMPLITRKVKSTLAGVEAVTFHEEVWEGKIIPMHIVFKKDVMIEKSIWKSRGSVICNGKHRETYWPKLNTKEGKGLSKKIQKQMKSDVFFQDEKLLSALKYAPKTMIESINKGFITSNTFSVGKVTKNDKPIYFFQAYIGYIPPRGVKEMLLSEYNKLVGEA